VVSRVLGKTDTLFWAGGGIMTPAVFPFNEFPDEVNKRFAYSIL
jgi:hypothetical protein